MQCGGKYDVSIYGITSCVRTKESSHAKPKQAGGGSSMSTHQQKPDGAKRQGDESGPSQTSSSSNNFKAKPASAAVSAAGPFSIWGRGDYVYRFGCHYITSFK